MSTPYRQCRVTYAPFTDDFTARKGEDAVDRPSLLRALSDFLKANNLKADWEGIENAPNEALVNALAMMSPYGTAESRRFWKRPISRRAPRSWLPRPRSSLRRKRRVAKTPLQ